MVEVVAEEIRKSYERHAQKRYGPDAYLQSWETLPDSRKEKWRDMAQTAIEVIRS
jgi:hypothetical protein